MAARSNVRVVRQRRTFQWARRRLVIAALAPAGVSRDDGLTGWLAQAGLSSPVGLTVVRVRGVLQITTTAAASQGARFGMIVRNQRPLVASVEDGPYNAEHDDWFVWQPLRSDPAGPSTTSSVWIDAKGSRQIREVKQELQIWVAADPGNAAACVVNYDLSIGVKLP